MNVRTISLKNSSWAIAGQVAFASSMWGLVIVLAKLTNPESVGRFTLALAITAPIFLFWEFQMRVLQATDARDRFTSGEYLGLRVLVAILALAVIGAIALATRDPWETKLVIVAVGITKGFDSISDILHGLMQKYERMDSIALSQIIRGVGWPISAISILYLTSSLLWATLSMAGLSLITLILLDTRNASRAIPPGRTPTAAVDLRPRWDWKRLYSLAKLALPLGFVSTLVSLLTNIPRFFLEATHGQAALGYFAAVASLPLVGHTIIVALGQAAAPRLARYYVTDRLAFKNTVLFLLGAAAAIGIIGIGLSRLFGPRALSLLFSSDYASHASLLSWMMLAGAILYLCSVLGVAMTAVRLVRIQLPLVTVAVVTGTVASFWLVPHYGELGAAWAFLTSVSVWLLGATVAILPSLARIKIDSGSPPATREA